VQILKRKIRSAIWRLKKAILQSYHSSVKWAVELLTERYWVLDYLPTFLKKRDGVLLVRLDLIGDFVLWLDAAQAYRHLYPEKKITLLVNGACKELADSLPYWDDVIGLDIHRLRHDFGYRLRILMKLRWQNFAIAIHPTFSREFAGDLAVRSTCATFRTGYVGDRNNIPAVQKKYTDRWYHNLIANNPTCKMELSINAHFVRELGFRDFLSNAPALPKTTFISPSLPCSHPYVVIAPGASWTPKRWPIHFFSELIKQINSQFNVNFILCGNNEDYVICESLAKEVCLSNLVNLAGKTTLLELIEVIREAVLVISNDSAPIHIAAATATPSVCMLGGGHFGRFLPYHTESGEDKIFPLAIAMDMECFGCNWACPFITQATPTVPCIYNLSPADVIPRCKELLQPFHFLSKPAA